ncbi:hypothetical protein EV426DRAFT_714926 [Tirmania nivea]|nr:hypothetical protein EV426DRAFT_714926 [Tirmania nivea]
MEWDVDRGRGGGFIFFSLSFFIYFFFWSEFASSKRTGSWLSMIEGKMGIKLDLLVFTIICFLIGWYVILIPRRVDELQLVSRELRLRI